jgi:hypothetical protein
MFFCSYYHHNYTLEFEKVEEIAIKSIYFQVWGVVLAIFERRKCISKPVAILIVLDGSKIDLCGLLILLRFDS